MAQNQLTSLIAQVTCHKMQNDAGFTSHEHIFVKRKKWVESLHRKRRVYDVVTGRVCIVFKEASFGYRRAKFLDAG
jgi:hypothetical protein